MLTEMVNIAVFAAFRSVFGIALHANAEFKRLRAVWQLDVARYGRQRWQHGWQHGWQNGNVSERAGYLHPTTAALATARGELMCACMRLFRCQQRRMTL